MAFAMNFFERGGSALQRLRPGVLSARLLTQWTGKAPQQTPGFRDGVLHATPLLDISKATRQDTLDAFDNAWTSTEILFTALKNSNAFFRPPNHNLRHPKIFYYSHPPAVYINKLRVAGLIPDQVNPYFERIFETGVDEMRWDDMSKNHMKWPSIEECTKYRRQVYETVASCISKHPEFDTIRNLDKSKFWAVVLGFEHERIHLETSAVLIRELPIDLVQRPEFFPPYHPSAYTAKFVANPEQGVHYPKNEFIEVDAGDVTLGKPRDWPTFGWDNEYGEKKVTVAPFAATKFKISNGEYLEFVRSQGYSKQHYWTPEGWSWRLFRNTKWPQFWVPTGPAGLHQYRLRAMFDIIDMPWNWPVIVNFHEAKAFANWRNERDSVAPDSPSALRILTELEHHRIRDKSHHDTSLGTARDAVMAHAGGADMLKRGYNLNLSYMSESPVDALPPSSTGFHDVFGNVWEWCEDHFSALPGFRVHPYYDDFSLPCFDGLHNIIMGGSYMSTGDEASIFARFHFRPHFHQFSGFRLVRPDAKRNTRLITSCMDNQGPYVGTNPFRSSSATKAHEADVSNQRVFNESIQHHYDSENVPTFLKPASNYPTRLANLVFSLADRFSVEPIRALDVGCGAGGVTFELCRRFKEVTGVDLNGPLIDFAKNLAKEGRGSYSSRIEGELSAERSFTLPADVDRTRAEFKQADAYCLPAEMTNFDVVLVSNLLCEIPLPNTALGRMAGPRALVRPGGLLIIASPFSWEENITPKDLWLGGFVDENGKARTSVQGLKALFGDAFELVHETELPTATRKHSRQFAVSISHVSVWQARK